MLWIEALSTEPELLIALLDGEAFGRHVEMPSSRLVPRWPATRPLQSSARGGSAGQGRRSPPVPLSRGWHIGSEQWPRARPGRTGELLAGEPAWAPRNLVSPVVVPDHRDRAGCRPEQAAADRSEGQGTQRAAAV